MRHPDSCARRLRFAPVNCLGPPFAVASSRSMRKGKCERGWCIHPQKPKDRPHPLQKGKSAKGRPPAFAKSKYAKDGPPPVLCKRQIRKGWATPDLACPLRVCHPPGPAQGIASAAPREKRKKKDPPFAKGKYAKDGPPRSCFTRLGCATRRVAHSPGPRLKLLLVAFSGS
jgi:hypothetical protein